VAEDRKGNFVISWPRQLGK